MSELHETHTCRDCGAEITIPYVLPGGPRTDAGLRERLLDIGADHEGHRLEVTRAEDSSDGPGWWLLVCETCQEDAEPLLDFAALSVPLTDDGLREAVRHALNELGVPNEDYPAPVANAVDILTAALAIPEESEPWVCPECLYSGPVRDHNLHVPGTDAGLREAAQRAIACIQTDAPYTAILLLRAALAIPEEEPGIDVERLHSAMVTTEEEVARQGVIVGRDADLSDYIDAIAAKYAVLGVSRG